MNGRLIALMQCTKGPRSAIIAFLLVTIGCGPKFVVPDPLTPSPYTYDAASDGEIKEALISYESQAVAAESRASSGFLRDDFLRTAISSYSEAARAAYLAGQLQKAITYGEKAYGMAMATKQWTGVRLNTIDTLIRAHRCVGNYGMARYFIDVGLQLISRQLKNVGRGHPWNPWEAWEAHIFQLHGEELMREKDFDRAINAFEEALVLQQSVLSFPSWPRGQTWFYSSLPNQNTLEMVARNTFISIINSLATGYLKVGKVQQAITQLERAFGSIENWNLKYHDVGKLYEAAGRVYLQQRLFPQAVESFSKALAVAEGQKRPAAVSSASRGIGDVFLHTGKLAEAITHYQKAIQQIESTRSLLQSEKYRQSYFEGGFDVYVSMIQALLSARQPEEAFDHSERARARLFLDVLGSRVQLSRMKSGLLEEERGLQERIAGIKARFASESGREANRDVFTKELAAAEKAYSSFLAKLRKENTEQSSLLSVEPLTVKEVQALLGPEQTLLEFFVTPDNTYLWVVDPTNFTPRTIEISQKELAGKIASLRKTISEIGTSKDYEPLARQLFQLLIAPTSSKIHGKELIIVSHDVLHYLPFQALLGPDGKYLIEKYPISYLSSASLLQFVKEKRKAAGEKVLAFGNPDLEDSTKELEFAELEAQDVKAVYPESTIFVRKEATEERGKTLSPSHDILHFATHAELKEDDPLSSAVLLAKEGKEDGRLEVREIFGMDLKANLVVLSGCETGLGKLSTGDELVGLTRAFIYAGTPSVVASLWKVDDSSTARLMANFYRNLKTMTKVEALRQAQLALIRGEGRSDLLARRGVGGIGKLGETPSAMHSAPGPVSVSTSHPYFWAPFILVGDGK